MNLRQANRGAHTSCYVCADTNGSPSLNSEEAIVTHTDPWTLSRDKGVCGVPASAYLVTNRLTGRYEIMPGPRAIRFDELQFEGRSWKDPEPIQGGNGEGGAGFVYEAAAGGARVYVFTVRDQDDFESIEFPLGTRLFVQAHTVHLPAL